MIARGGNIDELTAQLQTAQRLIAAADVSGACSMAERVSLHARSLGDSRLLGRALLLCAEALHLQARNEAAHAAAFEACALFQRGGDTSGQLRGWITLVTICREGGDLARAAEQARQGIDLAVRLGEREMTLRFLHSLAQVLLAGDEYEEAIRCFTEALARHAEWPDAMPDHRLRCAAELALTRVRYGERLALIGQHHRAQTHWTAARADVPMPFVLRGDHHDDTLAALGTWVVLQARWDEHSNARAGAAAMLRLARRLAGTPRYLAQAVDAVSTLHFYAGQPQRAIAQQKRVLKLLRGIGFSAAIETSAYRLADMYAGLGLYADALRWQKEAALARQAIQHENLALRQRMVRLERLANEQEARAFEALQHGERLLILGRLLGQITDALAVPAERIHESIDRALASLEAARHSPSAEQNRGEGITVSMPPVPLFEVRSQLHSVVSDVDLAAVLVQQLKLFSYRGTPQTSVLSMERVLFEAWEGLKFHQPLIGWTISMRDESTSSESSNVPDVEADAQRLGILLKLLLIGMTSQGARQSEARVLSASLAFTKPGIATLTLRVEGHGTSVEGDRWGQSLCAELAAEMGGWLNELNQNPSSSGFRLSLPCVPTDA